MMIVIADDDKVGTDLLILLAGQETSWSKQGSSSKDIN
jgi:hypothetical protein